MDTLGNTEILKNYKIAFFCSKSCPPDLIPKIYDWAICKRDEGATIISGFHTQIEKDVLKFLLKGKQSIIVCPARSLCNFKIPIELKSAYRENRILFISQFDKKTVRTSEKSSLERNKFVTTLSDEIIVGYSELEGSVDRLIKNVNNKKIIFL